MKENDIMKRYLATARMCLVEKSYFGLAELAGQYLLRAAAMGALLMIWRSLYLQGADMEGLTLNELYVYTVLSAALAPLLDVRTPASDWLHDGTMLSMYQRPSSVFGQLIAHTAGGWAMQLMLLSAPAFLLALLCGVDMRPRDFWFLPSLALAVSEGFAVDFLFTCLLIRLRSLAWPVHSLRESLTALLTGALIPFSALPWGIGKVLALTPFGTLAGAPLSLYAGLGDAAGILIAQVFWNLMLWPLAVWGFAKSRERMVSYGG
jgi:ABC-2 type transport system permease protein